MKNLILTVLSDSEDPGYSSRSEVTVFLESVKKIPNTDLIVISDVLHRDIPHVTCPRLGNIALERWLYYYQILCQTSYSQVLLTDSRDVYFQDDPFKETNEKLFLAGEGVVHSESEWNSTDQRKSQESLGLSFEYTDWPVVNGGIAIGPHSLVRDYALLIHQSAHQSATQTDQPVIGRLWNTLLKHNPEYGLKDPHTDAFCITGETVKQGLMKIPLVFENGTLRNNRRVPYTLFHQWDRTEYKNLILRKFGLS